ELRLRIDWRKYELEMSSGGDNINTPDSWEEGVAPSITEGVRTFLLACKDAGLDTHLSVAYDRKFDSSEVNKTLGFSPAKMRHWENTPMSIELDLGPLKEASLVVKLAI